MPHRGGTRCRGSPPRMRGKGKKGLKKSPRYGITPAYAGKRPRESAIRDVCRDHPRVCGEKTLLQSIWMETLGSPPRMRGKEIKRHVKIPSNRITPAYAGKRTPPYGRKRVSGEKCKLLCNIPEGLGSPPRMRGKVLLKVSSATVCGITPAYAGKSVHRTGLHRTEGDHPRVCGEKKQ